MRVIQAKDNCIGVDMKDVHKLIADMEYHTDKILRELKDECMALLLYGKTPSQTLLNSLLWTVLLSSDLDALRHTKNIGEIPSDICHICNAVKRSGVIYDH